MTTRSPRRSCSPSISPPPRRTRERWRSASWSSARQAAATGSFTPIPSSWNQRYEELAAKIPDWADCYGANFSAPLEALREIGGFDADLGAVEDIELGYRLCQAGCAPAYLPAAEALHDDEKPRTRILADIVGFGQFCAEFGEQHPDTRGRLLGWFLETTPREMLLRRLLLALRLPPRLIARPGASCCRDEGRRRVWFGLASKYAFWLGVRRAMSRRRWLETTRGVPVLLYHAFADGDEHDTYVLPKRPSPARCGCSPPCASGSSRPRSLCSPCARGGCRPRRSAVITIDDGYADNFEIAYPVLRRHRFPATVYMVSKGIGGSNEWDDEGGRKRPPTAIARAVAVDAGHGIQIGSHTQTHCSLPEAPAEIAAREVRDSRADLEGRRDDRDHLRLSLRTPRRSHRRAGRRGRFAGAYASHVPVRAGLGSDPLQVPRIEIVGDESTLPSCANYSSEASRRHEREQTSTSSSSAPARPD